MKIIQYRIFFLLADDESPSPTGHRHAGNELAQLTPFASIGLPTATVLDRPRTRPRPER